MTPLLRLTQIHEREGDGVVFDVIEEDLLPPFHQPSGEKLRRELVRSSNGVAAWLEVSEQLYR